MPASIFPVLLAAAIKIQPAFAELDQQALLRTFTNMWTAHPPPPADIQAATAILFAAARRLARLAQDEDDPFESATQATPTASPHVSPAGSPAPAGLPDITFPHIDPADVLARASLSTVPPSVKSLLEALLTKDQEDFRALDDDSMSLLRDLANRLFRFLRKTPAGTPSFFFFFLI